MTPNAPATLGSALQACGLVAILRGLPPQDAVAIGRSLYASGFRIIEVPLNSPEPLRSIAELRAALPADALLGAGTVLAPDDAARIAQAGGALVVMPHGDPAVIQAARRAGLACVAGVATPTEAFAALAAGADGLKAFPAEALGPPVLKAWRAVLPAHVPLLPVGGLTPDAIAAYAQAGASGYGLGSALYRPGDTPAAVAGRAAAFMQAWHQAHPPHAPRPGATSPRHP